MTSPRAVLIVDADPQGLESLVYGFQGAEWRMTTCPTPETASLLVKASGAQIVVVASRTEHEKMHALIRQLRAKEATRALPVLVLGPEDQRPLLKQVGEVDLLPLPAFVRDVLTASEMLVATQAAAAQQPGEEPSFHASLTSASTLSLVRTMNGLCRSGQLRLERHGRTGEILFHQGELTSASIGPLQAMAAVQHLMVWNDGKLELRLRPVPRRGQLHQSAHEFLLELDRFQRDYVHAMKAIGPATTVYATNPERLQQAGGAVPTEVTPVVRLCDGRRALSDIIDESPFRVLDTVRILGRLAELGVLTHADGKPVTGNYAAPPSSEDFLDTARITGPARAWPMPAPIGGFPTAAPTPADAAQPAAPLFMGSALEPPKPPAAVAGPATPAKEEGRPRRQTLELGIPPTQPVRPAKTPAPVPVLQPAKTPAPVVAAKPAATPQPTTPDATTTQASGATGGKRISASLAAKLVPTTTRASAVMAAQAGSPAPIAPSTAASPPIATVATTGTLVTGVIESRRTQQSMRAVAEHPRVIVEALEPEAVETPLPSAGPAVGSPRPTAPSPAPDAAAVAASGRITGVLQVPPSRRTAAQLTPPARASIQVDVSLAEPPHSNSPTPPIASAPTVGRVTGELNVAPSGRTNRTMGKAPSSFHIDPSLTGKAQDATPGPRRDTQPLAGVGKTPAPRRTDSQPTPGIGRRGTGGFSPIEKDFFEREADLYKEEKPESFADLDAGKAKPAKKTGGKPGRPYRK